MIETGNEEDFQAKPADDVQDTAVIFFSSGTTGLPKGIMVSHYGILTQNSLIALDRDLSVAYSFTTLYWISGVIILTLSVLIGGARLVSRTFHPVKMMQAIEQYRVTATMLSPLLSYYVTMTPQCREFDSSSLKCLLVGGGPLSEEQMRALREMLPTTSVYNVYGMTEIAGGITMFREIDYDLALAKPLSCGKPLPGTKYRVR